MLKHMPPIQPPGQPRPHANRGLHPRPPQPLNISTLSTSSVPPKNIANGGPRLTNLLNIAPTTPTSISNNLNLLATNGCNNPHSNCNNFTLGYHPKQGPGVREALTSLGLLCLVSLLLALLSLIFLLKISPGGRELPPQPPGPATSEDYIIVYDVTLALCALSLSLNLCCLLVCAIQFLFAVKLIRGSTANGRFCYRSNKYLQKSSVSRVCAVGGFFISIPIFLTGIILYTFTQFHSTPAIITSVLIGIGIVFCGGAMVHNVFVWQKEKTICVRNHSMNMSALSAITPPVQFMNHSTSNHLNLNSTSHSNAQIHPTSVTPLSPNHSHGSFNHSCAAGFSMRPSTATPPTPKVLSNGCVPIGGREASGSVSPGLPQTLDMSNVTSTSQHELSTLV
ncbi:uncharacterized protein LOC129909202 [Episyrphus balteatus]|uniref:uncharacterized protein LOC129909202 n=1 Tax=Episyrphus balteatus TaxID=286459 RepID=UPI0024851C61|nr:uncharacterized protein LOC129909202 [Episyrphus balteatus]